MQENPVDPGLSAEAGHEKRSLLIPVSIAGGLAIVAIVLVIAMPKGPTPPYLTYENAALGARFEYSSVMLKGPNFVKTPDGSILTVERFSLDMAKKEWIAGLPDVLFEQVLIQIQENYAYVTETSRTHLTIAGQKGVEVVMEGLLQNKEPKFAITIDIFADKDWVWVLRSYSPLARDAKERPLFAHVRDTFQIVPSGAVPPPS